MCLDSRAGLNADKKACAFGWIKVVETLLDGPNGKEFILIKDSNGQNGFITACNYERGDIVNLLLENSNSNYEKSNVMNLLLDHSDSKHSISLEEMSYGYAKGT